MNFLAALIFLLWNSVSLIEAELNLNPNDCFNDYTDQKLSENKVESTLSPTELSKVLIEGSHSFAFELLKALHKFESKDNSSGLVLSPSSIWSTLIITYMAAKGETEKELRKKLKLNSIPKSSVGMAYQGLKLWNDLKKNMSKSVTEKTIVNQANRIFIDNNSQLNDCFDQFFAEDVKQLNFTSNPIQSIEYINDWVKDETNGKITDLLNAGAINPWTKMIIANAVYFQSKWLNRFNKNNTKNQTFYISPTEEMSVQMMSIETTLMYGISERLQATAIELPYANPDYSMVIILPDVGKGLDSMISQMSASDLYELVSNMFDDEVTVHLPKFKAEKQFELSGPLYSIGIRKLFDPRYADLSTLFESTTNSSTNTSSSSDGFSLNSVIHKSYITVDEEGTEAAAATAMIYGRSGRPVFPTQFVVNRPFLYLIRDVATNFILFLGTVRKPIQ